MRPQTTVPNTFPSQSAFGFKYFDMHNGFVRVINTMSNTVKAIVPVACMFHLRRSLMRRLCCSIAGATSRWHEVFQDPLRQSRNFDVDCDRISMGSPSK